MPSIGTGGTTTSGGSNQTNIRAQRQAEAPRAPRFVTTPSSGIPRMKEGQAEKIWEKRFEGQERYLDVQSQGAYLQARQRLLDVLSGKYQISEAERLRQAANVQSQQFFAQTGSAAGSAASAFSAGRFAQTAAYDIGELRRNELLENIKMGLALEQENPNEEEEEPVNPYANTVKLNIPYKVSTTSTSGYQSYK